MNANELIDYVKATMSSKLLFEPEKVDYENIMQIGNVVELKLLAENSELFLNPTSTDLWAPNLERQKILGNMDVLNKYISDLKAHPCTCRNYKYLSLDPEMESDEGLVSGFIQSENEAAGNNKYRCQNCQRIFHVKCHLNGMGYDDYIWNENLSRSSRSR